MKLYKLIALVGLLSLTMCKPEPKTEEQSEEPTTAEQAQQQISEVKEPTEDEIDQRRQQKRSETHTFLTGQFDPATRSDFVSVDEKYADEPGYFLNKETYEAFVKMHEAAKADGINLVIVSAFRNFQRQKEIWEAKWTGERLLDGNINAVELYPDPEERAYKILEWSSMPGTSRHHWGTDFDLNALENAYFEEGVGLKIYNWLTANAASYGFCQPYNEKGPKRPWGYNEEKWHWSYQPLAKLYVSEANASLNNEDISGFIGSDVAPKIMVKEKYILGINPECY